MSKVLGPRISVPSRSNANSNRPSTNRLPSPKATGSRVIHSSLSRPACRAPVISLPPPTNAQRRKPRSARCRIAGAGASERNSSSPGLASAVNRLGSRVRTIRRWLGRGLARIRSRAARKLAPPIRAQSKVRRLRLKNRWSASDAKPGPSMSCLVRQPSIDMTAMAIVSTRLSASET